MSATAAEGSSTVPEPVSTPQIVKIDQGGVNARILAKEAKADFRRIEAASLKMPVRLASAEGKRFFVRFFSTLQLNAHFISVIARTRLDHDDIAKIEAALRERIDAATQSLDAAIDGAEALFKAHGIATVATYDTQPLDIDVGVMSSAGRRYLDVIGKLDQLMPLLQTLEIHEVVTTQAVDIQRAALKRQVKDAANAARNLATGLRRRMNAVSTRAAQAAAPAGTEDPGAGGDAGDVASSAQSTPLTEQTDDGLAAEASPLP